MRLRESLIATTLMSLTLATSLAAPLPALVDRGEFEDDHLKATAPVRNMLPLPPVLISKDRVLESVYYDVLAILRTSNPCSDFFGGPGSMEVFNQLVGQVRKDYLSASIAVRMEGPTINGEDAASRRRYRLFSKVSINANGAFYKRANFRSEITVPGVGTFKPNTREVRALILLHELGHLMQGRDGKWLLPDDGGNGGLSRDNSSKIEKVCGDQIKGLGDVEDLRNLTRRNQPDQELALDSNNSNNRNESPLEREGKN